MFFYSRNNNISSQNYEIKADDNKFILFTKLFNIHDNRKKDYVAHIKKIQI